MPTATIYQSLDMLHPSVWYGSVTIASSTQIQISDGINKQNYYGNFSYSTSGLSGGTITSTDYSYYNNLIYSVSGLSASATTTNSYLNNGDALGLLNYVLSGNDTVNGSPYADAIQGFAGNDALYGNAGDDVLVGGAGDDTLKAGVGTDILVGGSGTDIASYTYASSQYTVVAEAAGCLIVYGPEGIDVLQEIETLQFSDKSLSASSFATAIVSGGVNVIAVSSVDMRDLKTWTGTSSFTTSSLVCLTDGVHGESLFGSFVYNSSGYLTGGTIQSMAISENGLPKYNVTGMSLDLITYNNYVSNNAAQSLAKTVLSGNDRITGSAYDDYLLGYAGNDAIDGGVGTDTAVFLDTYANSVIARNSNGTIIISSTLDGTDTLTGMEFAQFADRTISLSNTAPTITSGVSASTPENISTMSPVYTVTATDPDTGTTLAYSIAGGADAALFNITPSTGAVTFKASPNFEGPADAGANNVYDITVRASDGALYADKAITITVTDLYEAPIYSVSAGSTSVNEGSNATFTLSTTNVASGTVVPYTLSGVTAADIVGGVTNGNATVGANGQATIAVALAADNLTEGAETLTVTAGGASASTTVNDTSLKINNAPIITSTGAATAPENVLTSKPIYTATATDPDANTTVTYSISGGADANLFDINASAGAVTFKASPNFEAPTDAGGNNIYDIIVRASDGSLYADKAVAIAVADLAENFSLTASFEKPKLISVMNTSLAEVSVGDVNGDGASDIIVANTSGRGVSISLGYGNGTFMAPTSFATGLMPTGISLADFNNDGKVDLATPNYADNTVSVLLGNGNGTFQTQTVLKTGTAPTSVVVSDVNGDSKNDIVVTNGGSDNVSIFLGNGNGTFQNQITYQTGTYPSSVFIVDFNADGKMDLVVGGNSGPLSILLGNGNGTFKSFTTYATGGNLFCNYITVADFNGDGKADIAATKGSDGTFVILLGNGDGTFQSQKTYNLSFFPARISAVDVTGDSKMDLIVTNPFSEELDILPGLGDGTFSNVISINSGGSGLAAVAFSDFNNDGKYDLVTSNSGSSNLSIILASRPSPTILSSWSNTIAENVLTSATVYTAIAVGPDANTTLTYSILGGADAALFNINASTGVVTFKTSPNYEAPTDSGANNVYDITVRASDGVLPSDKAVAITVTNVNEAPTIASGGTAITGENVSTSIAVYTATATDPDAGTTLAYSIASGADASLFNINATTGAVTFKSSPNFEAPADAGANNVYDITVCASDGTLYADKAVAITVTDVNETSQNVLWTKLLGSSGSDYAYALTTGIDGSIYISGYSDGNLDGQPNNGLIDGFLTKYNPDGSKAWTKLLGSSAQDYAYALTTGIDGSIYVSGYTSGTLDGQTNSGGNDAFLTKFNSDGSKAWTKLLGSSGRDEAYALTTGLDGAIYVTGNTSGNLDGQTYYGGTADTFLTKYTADGSKAWTKLLGATSDDYGTAITTGIDGAIYVSGWVRGTLDGQTNNGDIDTFVTKYNSDGSKLWTKLVGNARWDGAQAITTGLDGAVYVTGQTQANLDGLTLNGGWDAFITKYNSDGTKAWTKLLGTAANDAAFALTTGLDGGIYVSGRTLSTLDGQTNSGANDTFLTKYNPDGSKAWSKLFGSTFDDVAYALTTGIDGTIYVSGYTDGNLNGQSNAGGSDIFLAKISSPLLANSVPSITSTGTASSPENISTTTAVYTATATDPDANTTLTYSISGGNDAALFAINASTGAVTFKASPNFEAPSDGGANNVYDIIVQASDGTLVTTKSVAITVTDVTEATTSSLHGVTYFWKPDATGKHPLLSGVTVNASGGAGPTEGANAPIQVKNIAWDAAGHVTADIYAHITIGMDAFDLNFDLGGGTNAAFTSALDTSWALLNNPSASLLVSAYSLTAAGSGDLKLGSLAFDVGTASQAHIGVNSGSDVSFKDVATKSTAFAYDLAHSTTGSDGSFTFSSVAAGNYALSATRDTADIGSSITAADALAALKLAVAINPNATVNGQQLAVSPLQFMAADVNSDGKVTAADALGILKMAVKLTGATTPQWMFVEETRDLSGITRTTAAWDHNINANVQGDTTLNLAGFIKGDVNGSWTPPTGTQYVETSDPVHFTSLYNALHIPLSEWAIA